MEYGNDIWAINAEQTIWENRDENAVMDVSLRDKVPNVGLKEDMGIELVTEVVNKNWLRWLRQEKTDIESGGGEGYESVGWIHYIHKIMLNWENWCGNPLANRLVWG